MSRCKPIPSHIRVDNIVALLGFDTDNYQDESSRNEFCKLIKERLLVEEELFEVNTPWLPDANVAVISWDYSRHLSIPSKAFKKINDHFASALGYNLLPPSRNYRPNYSKILSGNYRPISLLVCCATVTRFR